MSTNVLQGRCFCGSVTIEASGEPAGMGYCHCTSCREWSASPVNEFSLWQPQSIKVTEGAQNLVSFSKTPASIRKFCVKCGGHVMTEHPGLKLIDVFAAVLPDLKFAPALHVNYSETVLRMHDGLPKFKDFPSEFGGSGEQIGE